MMRLGFKVGEGLIKTLVFPSEVLNMDTEDRNEAIRMLNGNVGIFFYERELWYPERLKQKLVKIVRHIDKLALPPMVKGPNLRIIRPKAPKRRGKIKLVYEETKK